VKCESDEKRYVRLRNQRVREAKWRKNVTATKAVELKEPDTIQRGFVSCNQQWNLLLLPVRVPGRSGNWPAQSQFGNGSS
jgi:hypothetical protein